MAETVLPVVETQTIKQTPMAIIDFDFHDLPPKVPPIYYREVRPINKNPIQWINPPALLALQMDTILRWGFTVDNVIKDFDYPPEYRMLMLGIIAQETQGYRNAECNAFDVERGTCAIGLMAIMSGTCGFTEERLKVPYYNIQCGARKINTILAQSLDHGFRPGLDATRAALGAWNCGWDSLLADNCFYFGGWAFADKVTQYWIPLLLERMEELK